MAEPTASPDDAACWAELRRRAEQPPLRARVPLLLGVSDAHTGLSASGSLEPGSLEIGSLEPALAQRLHDAGEPLRAARGGWQLDGPADAALASIARWLHGQGLGGRWRDERLAVTDTAGRAVAAVERAAVRPLGIATHAVHLVGLADDGAVWVQQRALDKATDPGRYDTLMGGLIAAGETPAQTLARETWEEAGLRLDELGAIAWLDPLWVRRPVSEGYMVEHIHIVEARLRAGASPVNQDGEVAGFERLEPAALRDRLRQDRFTLEAALVLLRWMARHRLA